MKDYPYMPGWRQNKENNKPAINHSVLMLSKYGVSEGEWDGNEWIQYRWSGKFKDSDVLYWIHLEDLQQLEKEGENIQQEQPSLPSNIDEAAEKYSENILANNEDLQDAIEDAFKEGAKWMAEQGATCNGEIQMDFSEPDDIYARRLSADYWNELGPALMKVEPGKVLIQIRKK